MRPNLGRMPFGKHRGKFLIEVVDEDPQYLHWLLDQEWVTSSLLKNIRLALKLEIDIPSKDAVRSRPLQLIIDKVQEALLSRGWAKGEAEQMIRRLMEACLNGKQ